MVELIFKSFRAFFFFNLFILFCLFTLYHTACLQSVLVFASIRLFLLGAYYIREVVELCSFVSCYNVRYVVSVYHEPLWWTVVHLCWKNLENSWIARPCFFSLVLEFVFFFLQIILALHFDCYFGVSGFYYRCLSTCNIHWMKRDYTKNILDF